MRINWKRKFYSLLKDLEFFKEDILKEIISRDEHPNIGKKGCVKRISVTIMKHKEDEPKHSPNKPAPNGL